MTVGVMAWYSAGMWSLQASLILSGQLIGQFEAENQQKARQIKQSAVLFESIKLFV